MVPRAFGRVARKVRTKNRKIGLAPVLWPNGRSNGQNSLPRLSNDFEKKLGSFNEPLLSLAESFNWALRLRSGF
jgi:hypothetical protein